VSQGVQDQVAWEFRRDAVFGIIPGEREKLYSYWGVEGSLLRSMWKKLEGRDFVDLQIFMLEAIDDTDTSQESWVIQGIPQG
jgi:hypothetical protein